MPIGIQRLNAHQKHPNDRIVFIKPLPGPTSIFAQDFLERLAAICKPIMADAHISVMTLEEYEPNPEFVGRNFNAGEIIQLVLKAPQSGHWLSFRSVQMVMMHELAHCIHMNHGKGFWQVRNQYAGQLRELWARGYTGDGFWGTGRTVLSGQYEHQGNWEDEVMPERLCGGTYRSRRGRKRKRGIKTEELTYAERQQRRIERKFGKNGQILGGEEETRVKLESGKKPKGKPRVAGSARGRELRAAAALARFGVQKEEAEEEAKEEPKGKHTDNSESDSDSGYENMKPQKEALDLNGSKLLDSKGHSMVKVCEDEDQDDIHVKREMEELQDLASIESHTGQQSNERYPRRDSKRKPPLTNQSNLKPEDENSLHIKQEPRNPSPDLNVPLPHASNHLSSPPPAEATTARASNSSCPICSMINEPSALLCTACSHVLRPRLMPGHWRCQSTVCKESQYLNGRDSGICRVCGERKSTGAGTE